jgi:hypothetical protein
MGPELEKYVFTRPTVVYLPAGLPHGPLEITRVDSPIIQLEVMLAGPKALVSPISKRMQVSIRTRS